MKNTIVGEEMSFDRVLIETQMLCQSLLEGVEDWQQALWLPDLKPEIELKASQCHREVLDDVIDARRAFVSSWSVPAIEIRGRFLAVDIEESLG